MTVTITVTIPVPIAPAAATATRPTATRAATTMGAPRAAVTGAAVRSRDQALSTSVAMSNANMSSGAMVTGATAVRTAIIRTGAIAVTTAIIRTEPIGGAMAMAMAVSGAAGQRRPPTATNRPPMDMKSRRGRQRRFWTETTTTEHDPEKHALGPRPDGWAPVFPCDKRGTRLRGDHTQTKRSSG